MESELNLWVEIVNLCSNYSSFHNRSINERCDCLGWKIEPLTEI